MRAGLQSWLTFGLTLYSTLQPNADGSLGSSAAPPPSNNTLRYNQIQVGGGSPAAVSQPAEIPAAHKMLICLQGTSAGPEFTFNASGHLWQLHKDASAARRLWRPCAQSDLCCSQS